jgi:Amt family ammonium transporter
MGALDFAGGIVIHTSAGISALVIAIMLGRRKGFDKYHGEFPPSNLPLACVGAAMLWMGWFGFNAGSALSSDMTAVSAVASTQIAACCSGTVWLIISWIRNKPSSVALINGVIAGLAGITPASGFISSQSTIVVGLILGFASYGCVWLLKHKLRIDDALDVSSVHGFTGLVGSLSIGICAQKELNPYGADGWIFSGSARLLGVQSLAIVVTMVHAGLITFLITFVLEKTIGFKSTEEEEELGLDHVEHQEAAYNMENAYSLNGGGEHVAFVVDSHKHD